MTAKLKNITIALLLVLGASSCKKGWLDVTSGSEIRSEDQFKTEGGFKDALIGAYIGMTNKSLYSKDATWNVMDLVAQQYSQLPSGLSMYFDVQAYNYKSIRAMSQIDEIWNKSYNTIANINNALDNIDKNKSVLNPISYSIIKGELLGLRAFLHFDLMRIYGYGNLANRPEIAGKLAIPYVTKFTKDIIPQLSYTKTFELLNKDINDAALLLKEDPIYNNPKKPESYYTNINRDGFYNKREQRMNYYAVRALQARVLQWEGGSTNLANATLAAEEVIAYAPAKLVPSPVGIGNDPTLYSEHIFNLNVEKFTDIINPFLKADNATDYNALIMSSQRAEELYETANPNIGLPDFRYNTLLSSQPRGLISTKFLQKTNFYTGKNTMPLIRLPEMYYIAIQYYATTNPAKAVDYLNKVRDSRGIIQKISSTDAEVITTELFKEYRKEFIMEGQLFFFYKRLGTTNFPGLSSTIVANDKIYLFPYPNAEVEFGNRVQ